MTWTRQQTVGKPGPKSLLLLLGVLCDDDEQVKRTQGYIAEVLECSKSTLKQHLQFLEDGGWISREKRNGGIYSKSDIITVNAATFVSTPHVDSDEDELETHGPESGPRPKSAVSHGPESGPSMSQNPAHAMSQNPAHSKDKKILNNKTKKDTTADADAELGPYGYPANTQGLIAEWIDHCNPKPPSRVIGQMSREIKNLFTEGISYDAVRDGLIQLTQRGQHPATLPSFVHNIQQQALIAMRPSGKHNGGQAVATGTQRAMEALAAGQALQQQYDQNQLALGGNEREFAGNRAALGAGSLGGQPESGPGDGSGLVGNPQPFRY